MIKTSFSSFLIICSLLFLVSCDAIVMMPYKVKNKTNKPIKIKVPNYFSKQMDYADFINTKDTIIELKPKQLIIVGWGRKIDFPWGTKNIYREQKGVTGFDLIQNDTIVKIEKSDKYWKYRHKSSVFSIKRAMLK